MKKKIFGRKVGSGEAMTLLIESDGMSNSGNKIDAGVIDQFVVASARRPAQAPRQNRIEGYVLFEGDPTRYEFTPEADFVYPAAVH
jgi:hypothetical protein